MQIFTQNISCRYIEKCAYTLTVIKEKSDIDALLVKVDHLENKLKVMSEKLVALEEKIQNINSES